VDKDGKRILDLPPNTVKLVHLKFSPAEHAFYSSRHARYKHDFAKLQETDTVMKNYCSILQELLRLRQICDHLDLVRSSEDANIGTGDSISTHGISKSRAIQLLSVMNEAGSAQCVECGKELLPSIVADDSEDLEAGEKKQKKPKKILASTSTSKTASAVGSKDDSLVITICKHQFCRPCFQKAVYPPWPELKSEDRVECSVCREVITPAIDVVELELQEVETGLQDLIDADVGKGKKGSYSSSLSRVRSASY
jgi:SWI/SNF-related matrix-associated actin-dependent regulator of chromatin subfamily A3